MFQKHDTTSKAWTEKASAALCHQDHAAKVWHLLQGIDRRVSAAIWSHSVMRQRHDTNHKVWTIPDRCVHSHNLSLSRPRQHQLVCCPAVSHLMTMFPNLFPFFGEFLPFLIFFIMLTIGPKTSCSIHLFLSHMLSKVNQPFWLCAATLSSPMPSCPEPPHTVGFIFSMHCKSLAQGQRVGLLLPCCSCTVSHQAAAAQQTAQLRQGHLSCRPSQIDLTRLYS